uniref:DUF218 domain-containing protein n=1 Tax=Cyanoptyche gloeocystis TaxID=77922 RepID=A0A7S2NPC7_9EUKA|mmetsp:Transcript_1991/g.3730  ORF Transcript_1991/g.3730 Transcript_1991/m.3730 type:complete len:199 (+) Transcript_1991:121-717(+)
MRKSRDRRVFLVLGGEPAREFYAASLAQDFPTTPIWVSSGSPAPFAEAVFKSKGVNMDRVHLDYRARDTLTNFTTMVPVFKRMGVKKVFLVTAEDHMPRALTIGTVVFGSRGIGIDPMPMPSRRKGEHPKKIIKDGLRSLVWLTTGYVGFTRDAYIQHLKLHVTAAACPLLKLLGFERCRIPAPAPDVNVDPDEVIEP